jgi:hypothetical protein
MSEEKGRVILRKGGRPRKEEPAAKPADRSKPSKRAGKKTPAGKTPAGKTPAGKTPAGKSPAGKTPARPVERTPEQEAAQALSKSERIPVVHAHRVLREEVTLEEVKEAMGRKDEATRLAREEGLAPSLAGQVASGHLKVERARILQRLRTVRPHPIDWDAFKIALEEDRPIAVATFAAGWRVGRVLSVDIYDFRFSTADADGEEAEVEVQKHDVKTICDPEHLAAVEEAMTVDSDVGEESLGASAKRSARIRPDDNTLVELLESKRPLAVVLRDGQRWAGAVASFGRWDVTLRLYGGAELTILFHALHSKTVG